MSDLGKNLSATKSVYRVPKRGDIPPRLQWRRLTGKVDRPLEKGEELNERARRCSRTVAEVRLVGADSTLSAIHTESNWRGAFEHTSPQAAIMAVLALIRRLTEQTQGSYESNEKIAATLNDLVAAFKDRRAIISGSPDDIAEDCEATKDDGDPRSERDNAEAASAADSPAAPQSKQ